MAAEKNKNKSQGEGKKSIAQNRKARHDYAILENFEAGICLSGTEVKSCRAGHVNLSDSYVAVKTGELILLNTHISPYEMGNRFNHEPLRPRKLLMHKREIMKLKKNVETKGLTIIPLEFYFRRGKVKVAIALCKGKNAADKRDTLRQRDDNRDIQRAVKR